MSKIEVDTIDTQSSTTLQVGDTNTSLIKIGKTGDTVEYPAGTTFTQSGTQNVTAGGVINVKSGGNITIDSGATITNNGTASGFSADLTNLNATNLTSGTVPNARYGTPTFSGANLTNLNATTLTSGTVATARLGSGTASSSTFLRGDQTYAEAGGGSWVKISTVTASSSSSVDFDNVASTYKAYAIIGTQIKPANNTVEIQMNFGSDGTNYAAAKTSVYYMQYNRTSGDDSTGTIDATNSLENATGNQVLAYGLSDNAAFAKTNTMFAYFGGLAQGGYSSYNVEFNMYGSNSYNYGTKVTGVVIGDVDCVRFIMSSGNIASGTFTLYGIDQS